MCERRKFRIDFDGSSPRPLPTVVAFSAAICPQTKPVEHYDYTKSMQVSDLVSAS
jgi:hypothetical protein